MFKLHFVLLKLLVIFLVSNSVRSLNQLDCRCRFGSIPRIVGGQYAPTNHVPWQAALFYNGIFICGGFILNSDHVFSASHCVNHTLNFDLHLFQIVVGSTSLRWVDSKYIYNVSTVVKHPDFNSSKLYAGHDIAFIKLERSIVFERSRVEPACLSFYSSTMFKEMIVSGYGSTSPVYVKNGLRTSLTPSSELKFVLFREYKGKYSKEIIHSESIYLNESTCNGDSGSPVMTFINGRVAVVGLNSFGLVYFNKTEETRCVGFSNFCRLKNERPFIDRFFQKRDYCEI